MKKGVKMLKTEIKSLPLGQRSYVTDVPVECPICGGFGAPPVINNVSIQYPDGKKQKYISIHIQTCKCCDKNFAITRVWDFTDNKMEVKIISIYPFEHRHKLPDYVKEISPRAYNLYNGAQDAYNNGYIDLAGTGFRNCLEMLIKDYAVNEDNVDKEDFKGKSLYIVIDNYLPDIALKRASDVVRILGNDFTHYEQEFTQESILELVKYLNIVIQILESHYLANHPDSSLQRKDPFKY